MKTDIQIAQEAEMLHIREVAAKVGIVLFYHFFVLLTRTLRIVLLSTDNTWNR